jgi:hypothetical protein
VPKDKNKTVVVPFHGITLQYSNFKEILILAPIQQGTEKTETIMFCFGSALY